MKAEFWEGLMEEVALEPFLLCYPNTRDEEIQEVIEASSVSFGRRRRAQGDMRSRECSGPRM